MKKIGLMLALLWVICALSWASSPDARIKGQLIDASTNQVINYADIFLFTMGSEKPLQQTFRTIKDVSRLLRWLRVIMWSWSV